MVAQLVNKLLAIYGPGSLSPSSQDVANGSIP
jgi:hypothetical protein